MNILKELAEKFNIKLKYVENTVKLIDEGNTIPFIARYRKELTGALDDQILRSFYDSLIYLRNLEEKKIQVKGSIELQGKLNPEIEKALELASTLTEVEDIYRPYRPKRQTKATKAKEKGLEPLADEIFNQNINVNLKELAEKYLSQEKEVLKIEDAIEGAKDIIAESIADDLRFRNIVRTFGINIGNIVSKKTSDEEETVYQMYYNYSESVKKIASHRVLALNRGENEKVLRVKIEFPVTDIIEKLKKVIIKNNEKTKQILEEVIEDSYKRLIEPSIEREIRNMLTEKAEEGAIKVFSKNLEQLLLQQPLKEKVVLAIDPGFRTGCKTCVIDETGKVLETGIIYVTIPSEDKIKVAKLELSAWINKHNVNVIAIGNGTASRETESFVVELIKEINKDIYYIIINEAGASVYSASKIGSEEFPEYDVSLRSAVSIGRRLQDPLAELVKIEPKSIGVGQYQHDMNQKKLGESLKGVVENCVNNVGVNLNTASPSLLEYVSGVTKPVARNILKYREENGKFKTRNELLKINKLGKKAFEQCAGFLRIESGDNPLDNTGVHPESYKATIKLLKSLGFSLEDLQNKNISNLNSFDIKDKAEELSIGEETLIDIKKELEKPGRDIREEMKAPILKKDILSIEDLNTGMILEGTVRNIVDFGAFVDIGVHQDGLLHISQISNSFIKHPLDVLSVGDVVTVKILEVTNKRISLSMKI